jgi:hypothetical protein
MGGMVLETKISEILDVIEQQKKLENQDGALNSFKDIFNQNK